MWDIDHRDPRVLAAFVHAHLICSTRRSEDGDAAVYYFGCCVVFRGDDTGIHWTSYPHTGHHRLPARASGGWAHDNDFAYERGMQQLTFSRD